MSQAPIRILCVDDNRLMAEALERRLVMEKRIQWAGWVEHSVDLPRAIREGRPDVVMLDIDMPGRDSFDVLRDLVENSPEVKVIMFSGHVRADYIDRAVDAGAWGYLSKNDSMDDVMSAILRAFRGEFVLSPDATSEYRRKP